MARIMSNTDVIKLFETIHEIESNTDISDEDRNREIASIQNAIVEGLSFLVYSNTKFYQKFPNYEDLVQEGFIGLIKAVRNFNYRLFPNFFIYAERWVRSYIKRSASHFDVVYNPRDKNRVMYAEPAEIGKEEESSDNPEDVFLAKEANSKIYNVLNEFPDREREIVERIFGLGSHHPQTLREIGPLFDLTYERVRQIKNKVISRLRKSESLSELH